MGRTAEAVPSSACRWSRSVNIRRQTSPIHDTGIRAKPSRPMRAVRALTVPELPNPRPKPQVPKLPGDRRPKPSFPAGSGPKTDPTSIGTASGGTSRDLASVRFRHPHRSVDPVTGRSPTCQVPALRPSPRRPSFFRSVPDFRSRDRPPRPHRLSDGPSRCLRAVFIFRFGCLRINKKISRNCNFLCISFNSMHKSSTVYPQASPSLSQIQLLAGRPSSGPPGSEAQTHIIGGPLTALVAQDRA